MTAPSIFSAITNSGAPDALRDVLRAVQLLPMYDDQNLTEDGSFEYTYDAENRLVEVLPAEDDPNNLTADDKKLVFTYDDFNRRKIRTALIIRESWELA